MNSSFLKTGPLVDYEYFFIADHNG